MIIGVNALFMIPGEVGGSETYLRRTLAAAAKTFPQHEFVVFANHENRNTLARDLMAMPNVTLVDMRVRAESRPRRALCEQTMLPKVAATKGVDVLYDDTDQRAGAKFAGADLIGIPWQIMVGPRGLAECKIEVKRRSDGSRENMSPADVVARLSG